MKIKIFEYNDVDVSECKDLDVFESRDVDVNVSEDCLLSFPLYSYLMKMYIWEY
jgi:hypothetical protein